MANARNNATTFLFVTSFVPLEENGRQISILMIMVAGAHTGAVRRSASPPPIALPHMRKAMAEMLLPDRS